MCGAIPSPCVNEGCKYYARLSLICPACEVKLDED